jgi:hypothetical protein
MHLRRNALGGAGTNAMHQSNLHRANVFTVKQHRHEVLKSWPRQCANSQVELRVCNQRCH